MKEAPWSPAEEDREGGLVEEKSTHQPQVEGHRAEHGGPGWQSPGSVGT